jgi:choline dehydrogenase-like flavoprotein
VKVQLSDFFPHASEHRSFSRRAAVALAEAILPGSRAVPQADEATVARADEVVGEFSPDALRAWHGALAALSAAAVTQTGRAFHELSAQTQDSLLTKWEHDPILRTPLMLVATIFKFVHFDRPDVYGTMGGKLNVVEALEQPRWLQQVIPGTEIADGEDLECEVVVVGTGAGGGVVGRELAEKGFAVIFVEEGDHWRRNAFDGSSVRAHQRFYRAAFSVGNVVMPVFMGRLFGGSTAVNGGTCFRSPTWVHDRWCETFESPEFSSNAFAPYYDKVERYLEVGPTPRNVIGPAGDVMARGCEALGWHHFTVNRNAQGCDGSGFCDFGCRTDAKRGTNLSYLPDALGRGALCYTGLKVEEVVTENGAATGVRARDKNGRVVRIRARAVVLAGGAIPTPLLLLQQGICNESGEVGKNLSVHPSTGFSALFDEPIRGHKHVPQGYGCDEFQREGIMMMTAQPDKNIAWVLFPQTGRRLMQCFEGLENIASLALMIYDAAPSGRVWRTAFGLPAITYNVSQSDVERMHRGMVLLGEMCNAAGAKELYPVVVGAKPYVGQKGLDELRKMKLKAGDITWTSYHPLGTIKMGRDARTSVVDLEHETHAIDRLFIVDGSTVAGPLGVNPQLTIMAMATRAAEKIAERL